MSRLFQLPLLACAAVLFSCRTSDRLVTAAPEYFPTSVEGLEAAVPPSTLEVKDGDTVYLTASPVRKVLQGREVRMLAYNRSIPGPTLRVAQGAHITLRLRNALGIPTTLHPHGLRLRNGFDGTPDVQKAIQDGDTYDYILDFPDPGAFWYHPHVREDYGQAMGLYGNFIVTPVARNYWRPVDREMPLMLEDVLMDSAGIAPFRRDGADHAMMGRFGNLYLANGDTALSIRVKRKEVIRLYLTNACSARVLNLGLYYQYPDGELLNRNLRLVGADMGRFERDQVSIAELLGPGERLVAEAYFDEAGTYFLCHTKEKAGEAQVHVPLAAFEVLPDSVDTPYGDAFQSMDTAASPLAGIDSFRTEFARPPDKRLELDVWMDHSVMQKSSAADHLDPNDMGIEWDEHPTMGLANANSTAENTRWIIRDAETGAENHDIHWTFKRGDHVRIRIYNKAESMHPMPHPIHFHGQRFLVISRNGVPNPQLAWKDTYLVGRGETAELLLDAANPGEWMVHCHIGEHMESMMMFSYRVE